MAQEAINCVLQKTSDMRLVSKFELKQASVMGSSAHVVEEATLACRIEMLSKFFHKWT